MTPITPLPVGADGNPPAPSATTPVAGADGNPPAPGDTEITNELRALADTMKQHRVTQTITRGLSEQSEIIVLHAAARITDLEKQLADANEVIGLTGKLKERVRPARLCFCDNNDNDYFDEECDTLIEQCEENGIDYVWETEFTKFSISDPVDDELENHYDGLIVENRDALTKFIELLNSTQFDGTFYAIRKIPLDEAKRRLATLKEKT